MANRLRTVLHPEWYQGHHTRPPYFEGWYFKLVDQDCSQILAVIPGILKLPAGYEVFIQVFDSRARRVWYLPFDQSDFEASKRGFGIRIGRNRFSSDSLELDIDEDTLRLSGKISFGSQKPWPVTLAAPGIMGWYGWMPFMQCYHGVVSLDHELDGSLTLNGKPISFGGGRGYTEKDWGRSFPTSWVWMQANHFGNHQTSLTASIAHIPWMGSYFPGFIIGLLLEGNLIPFATYTGAETEHLEVTSGHVNWIIVNKKFRLEIETKRKPGVMLYAPSSQGMKPRVAESLGVEIEVHLSTRADKKTVFHEIGRHGGLEVQGDMSLLVPGNQKHTS
jgi:hypothetical protein